MNPTVYVNQILLVGDVIDVIGRQKSTEPFRFRMLTKTDPDAKREDTHEIVTLGGVADFAEKTVRVGQKLQVTGSKSTRVVKNDFYHEIHGHNVKVFK